MLLKASFVRTRRALPNNSFGTSVLWLHHWCVFPTDQSVLFQSGWRLWQLQNWAGFYQIWSVLWYLQPSHEWLLCPTSSCSWGFPGQTTGLLLLFWFPNTETCIRKVVVPRHMWCLQLNFLSICSKHEICKLNRCPICLALGKQLPFVFWVNESFFRFLCWGLQCKSCVIHSVLLVPLLGRKVMDITYNATGSWSF